MTFNDVDWAGISRLIIVPLIVFFFLSKHLKHMETPTVEQKVGAWQRVGRGFYGGLYRNKGALIGMYSGLLLGDTTALLILFIIGIVVDVYPWIRRPAEVCPTTFSEAVSAPNNFSWFGVTALPMMIISAIYLITAIITLGAFPELFLNFAKSIEKYTDIVGYFFPMISDYKNIFINEIPDIALAYTGVLGGLIILLIPFIPGVILGATERVMIASYAIKAEHLTGLSTAGIIKIIFIQLAIILIGVICISYPFGAIIPVEDHHGSIISAIFYPLTVQSFFIWGLPMASSHMITAVMILVYHLRGKPPSSLT
ncbi:MAG: hypothetical protein PHE17_09735 [Thiothrix sp.]|uniref:hypothetical protein n=1 Tax=Thiothrix sp. TaxID=1032 RepID=UPI002633015E|nr:hypothetical protein [Thiothrix sp.]MDD5393287.1 hypothetical protein [Thiothrix sp.]